MKEEMTDLYQSAFVAMVLDIQPDIVMRGTIAVFAFPRTREVLDAMRSYLEGTVVNAYELCRSIKHLRAAMLIKKRENRNHET